MTVLGVICKTVGMQNNSMALLHVCHPPVQACGGEDTLYFLLFPGLPEFWMPLQIPLGGC